MDLDHTYANVLAGDRIHFVRRNAGGSVPGTILMTWDPTLVAIPAPPDGTVVVLE